MMTMRRFLTITTLAVLPLGALGQTSTGTEPALPEPRRGLLPDMVIPRPAGWGDDLPSADELRSLVERERREEPSSYSVLRRPQDEDDG